MDRGQLKNKINEARNGISKDLGVPVLSKGAFSALQSVNKQRVLHTRSYCVRMEIMTEQLIDIEAAIDRNTKAQERTADELHRIAETLLYPIRTQGVLA